MVDDPGLSRVVVLWFCVIFCSLTMTAGDANPTSAAGGSSGPLTVDIFTQQTLMGPTGGRSREPFDKASCAQPTVAAVAWPPGDPSEKHIYVLAVPCEFHLEKGKFSYTTAELNFAITDDRVRVLSIYPRNGMQHISPTDAAGIDSMLQFRSLSALQGKQRWKDTYRITGAEDAEIHGKFQARQVSWAIDFAGRSASQSAPMRFSFLMMVQALPDATGLPVTFSVRFGLPETSPLGTQAVSETVKGQWSLTGAVPAAPDPHGWRRF